MAHIPYYGEDADQTTEKTSQIELKDKSAKLYTTIVEVETDRCKKYLTAVNNFTESTFDYQIKQATKAIDSLNKLLINTVK
jgi:hypothetical protein